MRRALLLALLAPLLGADGQLVEGVAAAVGDEVILLSEVERAAAPVFRQLERQEGPVAPELRSQVRAQALQSLIDQRLIVVAAERMQLEASPEDVDRAIAGIAQEEGVSVEQVYDAAASQGLPRERYRERLSEQITRMKVVEAAVRPRVSVGDSEVEELYRMRYASAAPGVRVRARHILIPWGEGEEGREKSRQLAAQVAERAASGASFADLARQVSAAPSARDGGLTVFREGEVARELAPHVFGLGPGEISPPIDTVHGINLLQIIDRFDPSEVALEDVRSLLAAEIAERKMRPELERFIAELREQHYIEVIAPELR